MIRRRAFFLFDTRYDGIRRTFFQTSKDGVNWSDFQPIASIIEPGEEKSGHYQFANYDGEKLVCCFNRHINGSVDTRTNIYFIQSKDWGKTWTTADGTVVELPILREQGPALIRDFHKEGKNCYIKDINFDYKGNPVIYYVTSDNHLTGPDGGARVHSVARWTGKKWKFSDFTESTHCYDSGSLWVDGKEMTIITPSDPGPQLWGYRWRDGDVEEFQRRKDLEALQDSDPQQPAQPRLCQKAAELQQWFLCFLGRRQS